MTKRQVSSTNILICGLFDNSRQIISYYYTYNISKATLDLDPDLCLIILFFTTSLILHILTCARNTSMKKGFYFVYLYLRHWSNLWESYNLKSENMADVFSCNCVISSHRINWNASVERFHQGLHFTFIREDD